MTNICVTCFSKRANVRLLPCRHTFHDRCMFPWPGRKCPVVGCEAEIVNFEILKIEDFHYRHQTYSCSDLMHVFGINRRGRWTEEEYDYALALIEAFNAGLVHLPESLKLGSFLCKMLQCCSARLSSKIRKGKKVFHSKRIQEGVAAHSFEIAHYRSVQQKLSDAEEAFLNRIALSFDVEEASVLSYHIQHSWQKGFLASTHFDLSKGRFITRSKSSSGNPARLLGTGPIDAFPAKNMLLNYLHQVAHQFAAWPLDDRGLLMLEGISREFPTSIALALHVESRSVLHVSASFQSIVAQFITRDTLITVDDFEFVFKNHGDLLHAVTDRTHPAGESHIKSERDVEHFSRMIEMTLVDDGKCNCSVEVLFIGSISLSVLRFRRIPTCPHDAADECVEEVFNEEAVVRALVNSYQSAAVTEGTYPTDINSWLNSSQTQSPSDNGLDGKLKCAAGGGSKKPRADALKRPPLEKCNSLRSDVTSNSPCTTHSGDAGPRPAPIYSSSSMSLQRACGTFLLTSDKHQVLQQVGSNLMRTPAAVVDAPLVDVSIEIEDDMEQCDVSFHAEEVLVRDPIVNIVFSGRKGIGSSRYKRKTSPTRNTCDNDDAPTLLSATTTVDTPAYNGMYHPPNTPPNVPTSLDSILQSFLRVIPFHVVEIWVPVQLEKGATVLLYGASAALDKELHGWSSYSRNFSFNPDVGLPGRVASARAAESRTDVATLPMPTFLRAEMAGSLGIHAACGLPFLTGSKCDAVIVFYSRHIFEPTLPLIEYMGRVCEKLNIQAQIRILKPQGKSAKSNCNV